MTYMRYGKLTLKSPISITSGSNKKVWWICDCGKETLASIYNVTHGITKSCGKCSLIEASEIASMKFGKLRMKNPENVFPKSKKKVWWVCDCGKETLASIGNVLSGFTESCGKCNLIDASEIAKMKFGKLRVKKPENVLLGSSKKVWWICDCGKETLTSVYDVTSGNTKSCGKCNLIDASKIASMKFGKLRIGKPVDIKPGSNKKVEWVCDCGQQINTSIHSVLAGLTKSCGKCNLVEASRVAGMKFGRLRIEKPVDIKPGSAKKTEWTCDCGGTTKAKIIDVVSGKVKSCGRCCDAIHDWYMNNEHRIRSMQCPISPKDFVPGGMEPLETIKTTGSPFRAICAACKSEYQPRLDSIKQGTSLTCGCSTGRVSFAVKEIINFISSIGFEAVPEHQVGKLKYDVFVPKTNLLIEYNGLRWHSFEKAKNYDMTKYENAVSNGFDFIMIFEDEWMFKNDKMKPFIVNRLGATSAQSVRASSCLVREISSVEANEFYEKHHYIGECRPKISYGIFSQDNLLACMSFSPPTRQSKHQWELVRIASKSEYKIHGALSKMLREFIKHSQPTSIVSFSDNRLFSGKSYEKIGFRLDGYVKPDYYWVKGQRRFHKSALRKTLKEKLTGLTETELREAQGYRKIWDLGKKRWVYTRNTDDN